MRDKRYKERGSSYDAGSLDKGKSKINTSIKNKLKMNLNQQRTIELIRKYIIERELNTLPDGIITKFDVRASPFEPSYKYHKERTFVILFVTTNVKEPKNPYLEDNYHFIIGFNGGVKKARRRHFGGKERDITNVLRRYVSRGGY